MQQHGVSRPLRLARGGMLAWRLRGSGSDHGEPSRSVKGLFDSCLGASFTHLRAAAPVPASSGRTDRHRLNRGGDRQANRALHTIVLVRMRHDPRTRDYVARRTLEGLKTKDILRCLKRFVAREVYRHLTSAFRSGPPASPAA